MGSEEEMTPNNGTGWTQKEMLIRIDAKVDVIGQKQNSIDIEIALLKSRQDAAEQRFREHENTEIDDRKAIAAALVASEQHMAQEVAAIKEGQFNLGRAVRYATAVVIAVTVATDALIRFFAR